MKRENKKGIKIIKIMTIVLAIVLISMIGFFGIYTKSKNQMNNKLKDYEYSMAIKGARNIELKVNTETTEVIKDSEGNEVETATDEEIVANGYVKEEVKNNIEEVLTEENYDKVKEIIGKRLNALGVREYNIATNYETGAVQIEIPESLKADTVIGNLSTIGKFEIIDTETKEVLLDNSDIKSSGVLYNTTSSGTAVYLEIAFNSKGKNKLKEITQNYVKTEETNTVATENQTEGTTTDNEESTPEKTITMKIDDTEMMTTSFDEPITNGKIQLSVGTATTDEATLQGYITQAQNVAVVLDSGKLPIKYDIEKNEYILASESVDNKIAITIIIVTVVVVLGIIVLMIKFKTRGILAEISYIGFIALYLLIVRYTNVIISIESILGIITTLVLNYIFTAMLLKETKEQPVWKATGKTYADFFIRIIPICIIAIAFCFVKWIPMSSFGTILFWGLVIIATYNATITAPLLKIKTEEK